MKMKTEPDFLSQLTFEPVTRTNWNKLLQLFGEKGACGKCWCMYYRRSKIVDRTSQN